MAFDIMSILWSQEKCLHFIIRVYLTKSGEKSVATMNPSLKG